jgi:hypothetical protein
MSVVLPIKGAPVKIIALWPLVMIFLMSVLLPET